jgi:hypothetical protein
VKHHHQPGGLQCALLGLDVDVEVRVEAVEVAQLDAGGGGRGAQRTQQGLRDLGARQVGVGGEAEDVAGATFGPGGLG